MGLRTVIPHSSLYQALVAEEPPGGGCGAHADDEGQDEAEGLVLHAPPPLKFFLRRQGEAPFETPLLAVAKLPSNIAFR